MRRSRRGCRPPCARCWPRSPRHRPPRGRPRRDGEEGHAMTEAQWKLVVDQQGVTIASDKFQFTTSGTRQAEGELDFEQQAAMNSAESSYMESVVAQLQAM